MNKPSTEQSITIPGACGNIEARLHIPADSWQHIAILCHPHPLYGGTMHNKVVHTLAKTYQAAHMASLRFNFRGVGQSSGHYASGEGEMDDLMAVMNWVQRTYPHARQMLAGFSFGAYIALKTVNHFAVEQLILVAPPVENFPVSQLPLPHCHFIVVQGDADEVVSSDLVFNWVKTLSPAPTLIRIEGASHFFHGRLDELKTRVFEALR